MPGTHQVCRVQTGKLTGLSNRSDYSLEQKFQNLNLKIPENPLTAQWKRPIKKKSTKQHHQASVLLNHLQPLPSWNNNQSSLEKGKPVPLAGHTARVNIHPSALCTIMFFICSTSKNGKEEWAWVVHHQGGNLGITEQTTKSEQTKPYQLLTKPCLWGLRGAQAGSGHHDSSAGMAGVSSELISWARRPRGLSASGWY